MHPDDVGLILHWTTDPMDGALYLAASALQEDGQMRLVGQREFRRHGEAGLVGSWLWHQLEAAMSVM